jgi:hypothetical protein
MEVIIQKNSVASQYESPGRGKLLPTEDNKGLRERSRRP